MGEGVIVNLAAHIPGGQSSPLSVPCSAARPPQWFNKDFTPFAVPQRNVLYGGALTWLLPCLCLECASSRAVGGWVSGSHRPWAPVLGSLGGHG